MTASWEDAQTAWAKARVIEFETLGRDQWRAQAEAVASHDRRYTQGEINWYTDPTKEPKVHSAGEIEIHSVTFEQGGNEQIGDYTWDYTPASYVIKYRTPGKNGGTGKWKTWWVDAANFGELVQQIVEASMP